MVHPTEQDFHSMDLHGDEGVLEQAQEVEAEEVAVVIVAMVPTRDLLTDHETAHQTQITMTMRNMAIMDQEAPVAVAEEDTGADGEDGPEEDTEDHLPQDHQVVLT